MKYIVVHAGARDWYRLAISLYENDRLAYLVTDDIIFRKEYRKLFPRHMIKISWMALFFKFLEKVVSSKMGFNIYKDYWLGRKAGKLSNKKKLPIFSCCRYAMTAFNISKIHPKILFQYHPQSGCVKEILQDEVDKNPMAKKTILEETEFRYSKKQLDDSVREVELSDFAVGASTFTLKTLIKQGMAENCVHMAPYGVNIKDFKSRRDFRKIDKMRFLFVGSFSQRKGISYLLQAFKELENEGENISLTMAGRGIMDYELVKSYELKCLETHVNLPLEKLVELMQESDVFVFPSICEGFGLVLIQAMATGMPLITTYNTSGPDFIEEGKDGFLIEAQDVEAIKNKVRYFLQNPDEVKRMGQNAILKSKDFTWERFSAEIIKSVDEAEKIFVK